MGATLDVNVTVNILDSAGAVDRADFGVPNHATSGASFSERIRFYESASESAADSDLDSATKNAVATAFARDPHPAKVAVSRVAYVSLAADLDAVRAENDGWYGLDIASRVQADIEAAALWAESNEKLFVPQSSDAAYLAGTAANVGENLQSAAYGRTAGPLYHAVDAEHAALSWLSGRLAHDPDNKATIWAYDQLPGITVDDISSTEKTNVLGVNGNIYVPFKGQPATWPGLLASGKYIDELTTGDWIKNRTEERLAQLLLDATARGEKIPYTNDGIAMVGAQIGAQLQEGERIGHLRPDSSSVALPLISDIPEATIKSRKLTISATSVLAGAIQEVTVNLTVLVTL